MIPDAMRRRLVSRFPARYSYWDSEVFATSLHRIYMKRSARPLDSSKFTRMTANWLPFRDS